MTEKKMYMKISGGGVSKNAEFYVASKIFLISLIMSRKKVLRVLIPHTNFNEEKNLSSLVCIYCSYSNALYVPFMVQGANFCLYCWE